MERRARATVILAVVATCGGCGEAEKTGAPRASTGRPAEPPAPAPEPPKAVAKGEREVITEEQAAEHRANALERRETPLAVGAPAPRFDGYPEKTKAVLVFLRGEW